MKTREEILTQIDEIRAERRKLTMQIKEARRVHAATGKRADYKWFTRTEDHCRRLLDQENALLLEIRVSRKANDQTIGRRYWSLCRAIERDFGKEALASLVAHASQIAEEQIAAGIEWEVK